MSSEDRLKKMLSPRDRSILDAEVGTSWIPKDPIELITPYIAEVQKDIDRTSAESRLEKAQEAFNGYGKIIERCKEIEDEIVQQCKNVKVTLKPSNNLSVIAAIKRVFGTDGTTITFEMYKKCIEALARLNNENIPRP